MPMITVHFFAASLFRCIPFFGLAQARIDSTELFRNAPPITTIVLEPNAQSTVTVWSASICSGWIALAPNVANGDEEQNEKSTPASSCSKLQIAVVFRDGLLVELFVRAAVSIGLALQSDSIVMHCTLRQGLARLLHLSFPNRQTRGFRPACAFPFSYTRQFICAHLRLVFMVCST